MKFLKGDRSHAMAAIADWSESERARMQAAIERTTPPTDAARDFYADQIEEALTWLRISEPSWRTQFESGSALRKMAHRFHIFGPASQTADQQIESFKRTGALVLQTSPEAAQAGFTDITPAVITSREPLCIGMMIEEGGGYHLQWMREFRRQQRHKHGWRAFLMASAKMGAEANFSLGGVLFPHWDGSRWWSGGLEKYRERAYGPLPREHREAAQMYLLMALEERYDWHVDLRWGDSAYVRMPTDADGARELFADRDKATGAGRRSALRHWVRRHWRQRRSGASEVVEHLRGGQQFSWHGYECILWPSQYDRDRALVAKVAKEHGVDGAQIWDKSIEILEARGA